MMFKKTNPKSLTPIVKRKVRYTYTPVQETLTSEEIGTYVSYGISIRTVEEEIAFVSDISTEFEEVRELAILCTDKELSPEQFPEVIEDFLQDESQITA